MCATVSAAPHRAQRPDTLRVRKQRVGLLLLAPWLLPWAAVWFTLVFKHSRSSNDRRRNQLAAAGFSRAAFSFVASVGLCLPGFMRVMLLHRGIEQRGRTSSSVENQDGLWDGLQARQSAANLPTWRGESSTFHCKRGQ
jgi:hypothetical protein